MVLNWFLKGPKVWPSLTCSRFKKSTSLTSYRASMWGSHPLSRELKLSRYVSRLTLGVNFRPSAIAKELTGFPLSYYWLVCCRCQLGFSSSSGHLRPLWWPKHFPGAHWNVFYFILYYYFIHLFFFKINHGIHIKNEERKAFECLSNIIKNNIAL